ncbi:hypothetical protein HYW41_02325 [Candidatus Daviesbacteria bacterium]|nr:hypothetical protein [Candidatus Daviesbacteria bacterium]
MKLQKLLRFNRTTIILVFAIILLGVLSWLGVQKFTSQTVEPLEEVDLPFDAEGPYAILSPRRDGNALILNLKRTASYDSVIYELAYTSKVEDTKVQGTKVLEEGEGQGNGGSIDRGVQGTIDTKDKKGEYEQEILFGTCSKNVCKYDKGVENGTLTLHIKKGNKAYKMVTQWYLQKPDIALGVLTSGDNHLTYKVDASREELSNVGFSIINDLTGVPKLPAGKTALGKVYSLNVPIAKELKKGSVTLELAESPSPDVKLYRYNQSKGDWEQLDTKIEGSKLSADVSGAGIFAVFALKK